MTHTPVAIITGASRGMGAACAKLLRSKGYELVLFSPSGAKEIAQELDVLSLAGSVQSAADLSHLVETTLNRFGHIDAVINSTGHADSGDVLELTDEQWHNGMDLVLMNVIRMARLITPHMLTQSSGAFVNISTFAAFEPHPHFPISSCLRAALAGFTKLFADQYADKNIRMNNILPGYIESYEISPEIRQSIPMKRAGYLDEIAQTALFLISKESGYITGQNIRVDGGLTRSI